MIGKHNAEYDDVFQGSATSESGSWATSTRLGPKYDFFVETKVAQSDAPGARLRGEVWEVCDERKTTMFGISHDFLCIVTNVTFIPLIIIRSAPLICHPYPLHN